MLRVLLCCVSVTLALGGCVKKASYNNTGKPVNQQQLNADEAAKNRIALGLQYLKLGEMSNAKFNLEKALTFSPKLSAAHTAMAHYYQTVNEYELAEKAFVKALGFDGNDPDTLNNYGAFLCRVKRFEEAEKTFLKAIKVPSYLKVAESYENAALCAMENKEYDKAKDYFASSLDHSALRANTLINMAALSYAMGEYRDAQKYGQRLQNIGVVSPRVLLLRALTELKLGNLTQSKKHGTTLVSMYVKTPEALMYLSKSFDNSEFEQLRRVYLKHQYEKYKVKQKQDERTASSKNKVKKILKPKTVDDLATDSQSKQVSQPEQVLAEVSVKPKDTQVMQTENEQPKSHMVSLINRANESEQAKEQQRPVQQAQPMASQKGQDEGPKVEFVSLIYNKPTGQAKMVKPDGEKERAIGVVDPDAEKVREMQRKAAENSTQESADTQVPFHILKPGEFLFDVSVKYNIRMRRLMEWNEITDQNKVRAGQKIYLGESRFYHVINEGDTLYNISVKYSVAVENLLQWNKLTLDSRLTLGQKILIVDPEQLTL